MTIMYCRCCGKNKTTVSTAMVLFSGIFKNDGPLNAETQVSK